MMLDWILGRSVVSVRECQAAFTKAIVRVDRDEDGNISVSEMVSLFREILKHGQ